MQDIYEEHNRWDEDHRRVCDDCRADWHDAMYDMARDAELDAMAEAYEYEEALV